MEMTLGNRMKSYYEDRYRIYLTRRTPVIIRLDMKAGHTYTFGFKKPFDSIFMKAMQETTWYLCCNIQGAKLGYTQSDEISILITDFDKITTDAWFDYNIQKLVSISSSIATAYFNKYINGLCDAIKNSSISNTTDKIYEKYEIDINKIVEIEKYANKMALFDARAFNIPKEEVNNYFLFRQRDASKNSIQALAQSLYSHKQLEGLNGNQLQDKMFTEKGVNWNDLPTAEKRGSVVKIMECIEDDDKNIQNIREDWTIDVNIPLFNEKPDYVESVIKID